MTEAIIFYQRAGPYGFLSNFHRAVQSLPLSNGHLFDFPTNEHYYQSRKASTLEVELWIAQAPNPWLAMTIGRKLRKGKEFRADWESMKVNVMLTGLRAKFLQNAELAKALFATSPLPIQEDSPSDKFWGVHGQNMLGRLLVQVRDELRERTLKEMAL